MTHLTIHNGQFEMDGQPFRILAGAMHYFRVPPQYWGDRLHKLRLMGCNTLETYLAWNLHEPRPGQFCFSGGLDVAAYVRQAAAHDLHVILRPGPYICSEWEFGGLPAWLLADPNMRLRCAHPSFLHAVDRYLDALQDQLAPLMASRGGPVIALQVENEYGSYGNDKTYLRHLADGLRARRLDSLLFTSDGWGGESLEAGTLPDIYKTVNFGSSPGPAFARLRAFQPDAPLMCAEFWDGWFDHWGEPHHTRPAAETAALLDEMLAAGASVSFYMFHGGTNFGFMNGANCEDGLYQPTTTSYDYDAPLNECGDLTPRYHAFRQVIGRYAPLPDEPLPPPIPRLGGVQVELEERAGLFANLPALSTPVRRAAPEPMEALGQDYGFILYRTRINGPLSRAALTLYSLHDRAQIFVDGQPCGILERRTPPQRLELDLPPGPACLDILVENMGRVNFGVELLDRKGLLGNAWLGRHALFDWEIFPLPLSDLSKLSFTPAAATDGPAFYRGRFSIDQPADTFLALPGWTKGCAWVNGFHLGRYWAIGPQRTLYLPAPLLRRGENELLLFEQHGCNQRRAALQAAPDLGG